MNRPQQIPTCYLLTVMVMLGVILCITSGCATCTESDRILRERMDWLEEAQSELMTRHDEAFSTNEAEALIGRPPDARCSMGELQALLDNWSDQHQELRGPELSEIFQHAIQLVADRHSLSEDEAKRQFPERMMSVYFCDVHWKLVVRTGVIFPHTRVQHSRAMHYLLFGRGELVEVGMTNMPVEAFEGMSGEDLSEGETVDGRCHDTSRQSITSDQNPSSWDKVIVLDLSDLPLFVSSSEPIPEYDIEIDCRRHMADGRSVTYYWQGEPLGADDQGRSVLLERLRNLPTGTRVLVWEEPCAMTTGRVFDLDPWYEGRTDRALDQIAREKQLKLIHAERRTHAGNQ